jgi:hypothetical protein
MSKETAAKDNFDHRYFGAHGTNKMPHDVYQGVIEPTPDSEHGELKGSKDNHHPAKSGHDLRYFSHRHPSSTDESRRIRQGDGPARDAYDIRYFSNLPAGSDSRSRGR